jgi:acyl-CoA reductase-like NAD-dependent aldehyde dehydrogenase
MAIVQDEVFGPFVVIAPFHEESEAIKRANTREMSFVKTDAPNPKTVLFARLIASDSS